MSFTTFAVGGLLKHESPGPHVISELKLKRETPKGRTRVDRESLRFEVCDLLKIERYSETTHHVRVSNEQSPAFFLGGGSAVSGDKYFVGKQSERSLDRKKFRPNERYCSGCFASDKRGNYNLRWTNRIS